ncbi:hypothetical protein VNO77_05088 [Canavalia gladiata]|uniref:Uncharacterized protein n=1 Tax=Canavalia gladiata TaxID=3824 RepID=A0AAN9N483_CANGL
MLGKIRNPLNNEGLVHQLLRNKCKMESLLCGVQNARSWFCDSGSSDPFVSRFCCIRSIKCWLIASMTSMYEVFLCGTLPYISNRKPSLLALFGLGIVFQLRAIASKLDCDPISVGA